MKWHAVRFVYEHERFSDGEATYGETIVLFDAVDADQLFDKAEQYWSRCVELNPDFKRVGNFVAFTIREGEPLAEGTEVWCELSNSKMSREEFFRTRYQQFAIEPHEPEA